MRAIRSTWSSVWPSVWLSVAVWAGPSAGAWAGEPTDDEISRLQALFGLDTQLETFTAQAAREFADAMIATLVEDLPPSAEGMRPEEIVPAELREQFEHCVRDEMRAGFAPAVAQMLRGRFESQDVAAWLAFARTEAGEKVLEGARAYVQRSGKGSQGAVRQGIERTLSGLTPSQAEQAETFLESPAGRALHREIEDPDFDPDAVSERIYATCILDPESERRLDELMSKDPDGVPDAEDPDH